MISPSAKRFSLRFLSAGVVALAACSREGANNAASDSALTRDLALAGQQTQVAPPTFQDTTVAPAPEPQRIKTRPVTVEHEPTPRARARQPRTPEPRPQQPNPTPAPPPQPAPVQTVPVPAPISLPGPVVAKAEIGAGSTAGLTSGAKVCSGTNLPGDKVVATLNEAVTGTNGALIPAGSAVVLEVASVPPADNPDNAQVAFRVRSVVVNDKTYNVDATVTPTGQLEKTKVSDPNAGTDKTKVIGGAIAGAILGQMIGHNTKGTIIGAAAGGAAGAAASHMGGTKWQACLPAGAPLRLTLNAPLVISS
jgi:hypothetical protein